MQAAPDNHAIRAARRYEVSIDRAGLALGTGALLAGLIVLALMLLGGERNPIALASGWLFGSLFSALVLTAIGGPLWMVLHVAGLRRMRYAATAGAVTALVLLVGAQTYGFGLFPMPVMDARTWAFRWISALATSGILAAMAAGIAALMWRIAYRVRYEL